MELLSGVKKCYDGVSQKLKPTLIQLRFHDYGVEPLHFVQIIVSRLHYDNFSICACIYAYMANYKMMH